MKRLLFVLFLLLPAFATGQFKLISWYEQWCEIPLGTSGYGAPPHQINWNGFSVVVHFDNRNIDNTSSPYWAYLPGARKAGGETDSVALFYGPAGGSYNYVDSLTKYVHLAGGAVVIEVQNMNGTVIPLVAADSVKTDEFWTAVAQWCERHNYDGVDINWEGFSPSSYLEMSRFVRIARRKLTQYLTTPVNVPRPWLSLASPPGFFSGGSTGYRASLIVDSVDMACGQQGTLESVYSSFWGSNCNWFGMAVKLKASGTYPAWVYSTDLWLQSLSQNIGTGKQADIWTMVSGGWPKAKIAPANGIGGGNIYVGSDTVLGKVTSGGAFRGRFGIKDMENNGGTWKWDVNHQASYISGTATASLYGGYIGVGQKFFAPVMDSTSTYYATSWLIQNGFGGISPFSIQYDIEPSAPINYRLPAHNGILAAMTSLLVDNRQLKASANGLYFTKQDGTPVFLNGASTWDLFAKCSDYRRLLDSMATHNINFLNARAASPTQVGGPTNVLGNNPWVGTQTFASALNEPYWLRVDSILQYAQTKNIYIAFYPDYLGFDDTQGWWVQTANSSTAQMKAYGQTLGTRYKDYWNILWVAGGDRDPGTNKSRLDSMVAGFKAAGDTHLWSSRDEPATTIANHWNTTSYIDFNYSYPYWTSPQPVEQVHLFSRTMRRRVPAKPAGLTEAGYEGEHGAPVDAQAVTQLELRQQSWGGFLSGGIAYDIFGNCPMWSFGNYTGFNACTGTWQAALNSQGMINKKWLGSVLNARNWWNAIPDTSGVVADSGFGTLGNSNYIPTSYTSDSSFIMSYFSTQRNLRVKLAYVKGDSVTISWINPATGAVTSGGNKARATTTLRPPSTGDWVLAADSYTIVAGPTPVISVSVGSLSAFSAITPNPSTSQNYTVSGSNLTANITVTAPTDFQVSLNNSTWSSSVTLTQSGGTVSATTVYARMNRSTAGSPSGSITHTSTGATTQNVSVSGTVTDPVITISVTSLPAFSSIVPNPSSQQSYTVSGTNLVNGNLTITAPTDFQVSLTSGANWVSAINITPSGGTVPTTTIYVRMYRTTSGSPSGGISNASPSATEKFVSVSGTATNPTITIDKSSMVFSSVVPNPSTPQSYNVSATELGGDLVISAPTDFEVSTSSGSGYTSTVSLTPTGGSIPLTIIWVRMNRTTVGSPAGNLNNSSVNAVTKTIALSGTATASPPQHRRIFIYRTP